MRNLFPPDSMGTISEKKGLVDFRYVIAYHATVANGNEAPAKIIYIEVYLIAAVRLARGERWDNSPRVVSRIADAIQLAKRIYQRMQSDFGHDAGSR
jgi:hypothetical protein